MKRLRDDVHINSRFKRPFASSRGESYGQPQISVVGGGGGKGVVLGGNLGDSGGTQKLTKTDALTYLKEVKEMFQDQREKYDLFLDVMKGFKAQRIDTTGVIARVKELFKGHNNLIFGFNTFLPKGYEITVIDEEEAPPKRIVEFDEAINFVNKIKKRFQNDDQAYKSFLDILNMRRKEHKGISEVYEEVAILFREHQDLLEEFIRFLPDSSASIIPSGRHSFQPHDRSFAMTATRQEPMHKQCMDKTDTLLADHGQNHEHAGNDEDKTTIKLQKDLKKHVQKDNKERKTYDREPEIGSTVDINMQRLRVNRNSNQKFEGFGMNPPVTSCDDKKSIRSMYKEEFIFCEKVKERLGSSDDYQAFLKCLHIYSTEIINRIELQSLVADLLGKYPDLMDGFNEFLEHCENIDGFLAGFMKKKSLWNDGRGKKEEQKHELEQKGKEKCTEKYLWKSIQELDLSDCQSCSISYRLLPDDYPISIPSQRSELGTKVLNDIWVSVTSGNEDYSFKQMRRNPYEEILFRCEDDRFELDLLLESVNKTAKRVEELLNSLNNNTVTSDSPIRIEDHLTVSNLRCIEHVYGDHGLDVMEILKKNSCVVLPVILTRLKQKQEDWKQWKTDVNKVWAEIYVKNHSKSLDHRSFYFKQQDSKNLSMKSFVTEIKEIKEKAHKVDDTDFSLLARSRYLISPHLKYEYIDAEIHEDLYKLVKYFSEEVCSTKEQLNKVMKLWTSFLEPMLGVSSQSHRIESTKDDVKARQHSMKSCKAIIGDNNCTPAADMSTSTSRQAKSVSIESQRKLSMSENPCRTSLENEDALSKQDGYAEKEQMITAISDKVSEMDVIACSSKWLISSNASIAVVGINSEHAMIPTELASGPGAPAFGSNVAILERNAEGKSDVSEDGKGLSEPEQKNGESSESNNIIGRHLEGTEKEEGELSPSVYITEDNPVCRESCLEDEPKTNHSVENMDVDNVDSEKVSNSGDVSEIAADECSHEGEDGEHDGKVESECDVDGTPEVHFGGTDNISKPMTDSFLQTVKPLAKQVTTMLPKNEKKDSRVFYGNDTFYVLFRLHQILYQRLLSAKLNSKTAETKWKTVKDGSPPDLYGRIMSALYNLLDGSIDNAKFEDDCRAIIGNQCYVLLTLDKLIYKIVKQLQMAATDETDNKLLQLHEYEQSRRHNHSVDSVYYDNVCVILHNENIYRLEISSAGTCLSIQLMDDRTDKADTVAVSVHPDFSNYLHKDFLSNASSKREPTGIYLQRNKRKIEAIYDICAAHKVMEGVSVLNGLECKMSCSSYKISYVLDTEDFFARMKRGRHGHSRVKVITNSYLHTS